MLKANGKPRKSPIVWGGAVYNLKIKTSVIYKCKKCQGKFIKTRGKDQIICLLCIFEERDNHDKPR